MLGDWLHRSPYAALAALRKNQQKPVATEAKIVRPKPRIADIRYAAPSHLLNGRAKQDPWTYSATRQAHGIRLRASSTPRRRLTSGCASPALGIRSRLRILNGPRVEPVYRPSADGMAETYDAVVTLSGSDAIPAAVAIDGSAQAIGGCAAQATAGKSAACALRAG
jgi:hypothetical protein